MVRTSPWLETFAEGGAAPRLRLVCFHHAGGGASTFRPWTAWLPEGVALVAVQLPGREGRLREPLRRTMEDVAAPIADALARLPDAPSAFFGHSTGALVAFEVARGLRARGLREPRLLIASSQNAPRVEPVPRHRLPDREFVEILRGCRGTPDAVLENPKLLALLLPRIRADGAVCETYRYRPEPPLGCRIVVLHGAEDALVSQAGLEGWKEETRAGFARYAFPGGHFFMQDAEDAMIDHIRGELAPLLGPPAAENPT